MVSLVGAYQKCLSKLIPQSLQEISEILANAREIFIAGNGGSAATATHFAADLRHAGIRASCLTDNISMITALANDIGYEDIFAKQLVKILVNDILVLISASGNSPNLIKAASIAHARGATIIAFLGFGGGRLQWIANHKIILSSKDYGEVEGIHSCLCHIIPTLIREAKEREAATATAGNLRSTTSRGPRCSVCPDSLICTSRHAGFSSAGGEGPSG